jgi:hypothetical protein
MFVRRRLILSILASLSFGLAWVQAATLHVEPTGAYTTIQAALNAATSGDTIIVKPGTYDENPVILTPGLSIEAEDSVVINGHVTIDAAFTTFEGFTVNSVAANNWAIAISSGASNTTGTVLPVNPANNCTIKDNAVTSGEYGIVIVGPNISGWLGGCADTTGTVVSHNSVNSGWGSIVIAGVNGLSVLRNSVNNGIYGGSIGVNSNVDIEFNWLNGSPIDMTIGPIVNVTIEHNHDVGP